MAEERKGIYQSLPAWLRLMRPEQWTKNGLVLAAFFFAYWDPQQHLREQGLRPYAISAAAAALFCLVSSGIYALNDWRDRVADRLHPVKRLRPVASGEISSITALAMAAALLAAGIIGSLFSPKLCAVIGAYIAIQLLYTFRLKHIPLVIFGVFRYLHLVYTARAGERPEQVLLTDKAIIATIILYGLVVAGVFLYR